MLKAVRLACLQRQDTTIASLLKEPINRTRLVVWDSSPPPTDPDCNSNLSQNSERHCKLLWEPDKWLPWAHVNTKAP